MDILFLFLAMLIGYIVGWHHHAFTTIRRMIENPEIYAELLSKLKEVDLETIEEAKKETKIRTEMFEGQWYIYDDETFLAQGKSLSEALDNAEKRFPGQYEFRLRLTVPNESNQST